MFLKYCKEKPCHNLIHQIAPSSHFLQHLSDHPSKNIFPIPLTNTILIAKYHSWPHKLHYALRPRAPCSQSYYAFMNAQVSEITKGKHSHVLQMAVTCIMSKYVTAEPLLPLTCTLTVALRLPHTFDAWHV